MRAKLERFTVQTTESIRTAMLKITVNKCRVVVVLDGSRVVGTVSDGDIRRALLKETLPIAPVEQIMNLNCFTTHEQEPQRLTQNLQREKVTVLPIVDDENRLLDIAIAYEPFLDPPGRAPRHPS